MRLRNLAWTSSRPAFPIASPGDFEAVQADRPAGARPDHLRPGPLQRRRHRPRLGSAARMRRSRASTCSWPPAPSIASSSCSMAKEEIVRRAVERRRAGARLSATMSSFRRKMPPAPSWTSWPRSSRRRSKPAPPRSTSPTPSATRPGQYAAAIRYLKQNVRGIDKIVLSVHCHNDLGLAVANSLAALKEGARQVECTINGLGERAGNCALEEIVMAVRTRSDFFSLEPASTPNACCRPAGWFRTSPASTCSATRPSSAKTPSPTKPASIRTACSSIATTYEIMRPEDVGVLRTELVLGKHSGRHALSQRIRDLGYHLDDRAIAKGVRRLQGPGRPQEDDLRRRHRSAGRSGAAHRAGRLDARSGHLQRRLRRPSRARPSSSGTRTAPSIATPAPATAPSTPSSRPSSASPASMSKLREFSITSVTDGEDAQGEAQVEAEYQWPDPAWPGRQHRHHRSQRPGVPAGHQSALPARAAQDEPADGGSQRHVGSGER